LLKQQFGQHKNKIVVDLACGTGNITLMLAQMGYDMIGVDMSVDMLSQAQLKCAGENILFLCQDMRELDLYGTVDAVICTCDGMNYILAEAELGAVFRKIKMFLNPGGVLIFDMNTVYKFANQLGNKSFEGEADGQSYVWNNDFDHATQINKYHVVFNTKENIPFEEVHYQRGYHIDVVCDLLKEAGYKHVQVKDGYSDDPPSADCARVVFVASC